MASAENKCRTTHNMTALSFTTASIAGTLSVTTIAMNALMMYIIVRGNRSKLKSSAVASGALINTVIADLLTGILTDIVVTASHTIEGLQKSVRREILVAGHVVHFLTTGAALSSVTLLCTDRITALLFPIFYQNSKIRFKTWHMFLFTWLTSSLFLISYFQLGFIKHLAVYASVNITFPAILMVFSIIAYREKFYNRTFTRKRTKSGCSHTTTVSTFKREKEDSNGNDVEGGHPNGERAKTDTHVCHDKSNSIELDATVWSTCNSLPANTTLYQNGMKPFYPEICSSEDVSYLQQVVNNKNNSDGISLTPNTNEIQNQRKGARSSSVRFVDEEDFNPTSESLGSNNSLFSFITKRTLTLKLPSLANRKLTRHNEESFDCGSDSSVSMVTIPCGRHQCTNYCRQEKKRASRRDRRLLRALIINLCVFMLAYTPSICFIIYLNTCVTCNCVIVHILRDAVGQFVRLASLLRPLTFLICTKSLKEFFRRFRQVKC